MKRFSTFLVIAALLTVMVGCAPVQYNLTISSSEGGEITTPDEETSSYDEGTVVPLVALPHSGYRFVNWTGDVGTIDDVDAASTTITIDGDYSITATFAVRQFGLLIQSTEGGRVTTPGERGYVYEEDQVVNLAAVANEGYQFTKWTGDVGTVGDVNAASTTITMRGDCTITATFAKEIRDWYDLDAIRDNLNGYYILMNDLDSNTAGYAELASATANGGKGWEPIGSLTGDPVWDYDPADVFTGGLKGQGYEILDMFIDRPGADLVGLFGVVGHQGTIEDVAVVSPDVTGRQYVGALVGDNQGAVSDSYSLGSVVGSDTIGGLVGWNGGTLSSSYSTSGVTADGAVGGLVGWNSGTLSDSYSLGSVTGSDTIGGLVGWNHLGTVSNSYFAGTLTGAGSVGGLVGENRDGTVSNCYYSYNEVLMNGTHRITIGAVTNEDFDQWLANDKSLDVNERLSQEDGYYLINDVGDFEQLLAFGQDSSLKFRLKNDLDLGDEPNFYIPYLAGEFDGSGHKITNLRLSSDIVSQVGLFGYLASGGTVTGVSAENVNVTGYGIVGGLVGENDGGTVSDSYTTGRVAGRWSVGGLVGWIGFNRGAVSNAYYNYDEVLINGEHIITIGALPDEDFERWLANNKFLDANERLSQEDGYYLIDDVSDFKQLLAFGQDPGLKFRLNSDLDLAIQSNFYIPYLAGEFDGDGHRITNLRLDLDFVAQVGLFGYLASGGKVSEVGVEDMNITTSNLQVGGLVGGSSGTVSNCYCTGSVIGSAESGGGLVGWNDGTVSDSYSTSSVTGSYAHVGGLVGWSYGGNYGSTVSNSYSTGSVVSNHGDVGGLMGMNSGAIVSNSFWDVETSGTEGSAAGMGKSTVEMQDIATFSGAAWDITAIAPGERNTAYTWSIVDGETYPFLSWEPVP